MVKLRRLTAVTLSSALVAAGALLASPAAHAVSPAFHEVGLYGTTDPTYDGVYRQSLAILGLKAAGRTPAPEAVQWLLNQQCADGGFSSYKSTVACPAFDSVAFTGGRDSNATAMAVSALEWIGTPASIAAATKAATYLRGVQQSDGGWELYPGSGLGTDPNSTGLVLLALDAAGLSAANPTHTVAEYYQGMQLGWTNFAGTPTANLGGIITPWDLLTPNDFASVQSIPGLRAARLTALGAVSPAEWQDGDRAPLTAAPPMTRADEGAWAASWLEAHITDPATFASTHPTNAAWAVISLASDLTGENTAHALETALSGLPADPSPAANGQYALAALTVRDSAMLQTYATRIASSLTPDTSAPNEVWSTTGTSAPASRIVTLRRSALSDGFWSTSRLRTVITWGDGTHTTVAPSTTSVTHAYAAARRHTITVTVTDPSGNRAIRTDAETWPNRLRRVMRPPAPSRGGIGQVECPVHTNEHEQKQHHDREVEAHRPDGELRDQPTQQLHRGVGDRHDYLEDHHGDAGGVPVTAERPDELDDDPGDEKQPEEKEDIPEGMKDNRLHGSSVPNDEGQLVRYSQATTGRRRSRFRRSDAVPPGTRRRRPATAGTPWSRPCRTSRAARTPGRRRSRPAVSRRRFPSRPGP